MTIYGYCRVSTEEQAQTGSSIQAQINELLSKGVLKDNIYIDEGKSAGINEGDFIITDETEWFGIKYSKKKRPAFSELRSKIKKHDTIMFQKWDRLSRDIAFLEMFARECNQKNVMLSPIDDNPDELFRQLMSFLGQWERKTITKRINKVMKDYYIRGIHPYRAVFGYDKNVEVNGRLKYPKEPKGALIINSKQGEKVKEIFRLALEGMNYRDICDKFKLDPKGYYNIIQNRLYCGYIKFAGEEKKGIHEQLITEEQYDKANKKK